jgi:hypothetical protein
MYGRLAYGNGTGIPNTRILLSYSTTGGDSWTDITSATTGLSGNFSAQWIPAATGVYNVRAAWVGNQTQSTQVLGTLITINLAVLPFEEQYVFSVLSNSTVSAFSFNSTTRELQFTVSGQPGTYGYVDITIAKSLIVNIADLKIYLDGTETSFTTTSTDNSWVIHFSYHHSAYNVLVRLGGLSATQVLPWGFVGAAITVLGILIIALILLKRKVVLKR